jgi:hypothetical protein
MYVFGDEASTLTRAAYGPDHATDDTTVTRARRHFATAGSRSRIFAQRRPMLFGQL